MMFFLFFKKGTKFTKVYYRMVLFVFGHYYNFGNFIVNTINLY